MRRRGWTATHGTDCDCDGLQHEVVDQLGALHRWRVVTQWTSVATCDVANHLGAQRYRLPRSSITMVGGNATNNALQIVWELCSNGVQKQFFFFNWPCSRPYSLRASSRLPSPPLKFMHTKERDRDNCFLQDWPMFRAFPGVDHDLTMATWRLSNNNNNNSMQKGAISQMFFSFPPASTTPISSNTGSLQ
jgi:hypothetical protein